MTRAVLLLSLVSAGCAPAWVAAEGTFEATKAGYEVAGPPGWMRRNLDDGDLFLVTRDGVSLQRIIVSSSEVGKPIGLGWSTRPATAGMSLEEMGELIAENLRSVANVTDFRILESGPVTLSGRQGVRVLVARRQDGLPLRSVVCAVQDGGRVYLLFYDAPERHYFALDLPVFERVLKSFELLAPHPG